jgi:nucleoside 2-deoxyribosyltransferase
MASITSTGASWNRDWVAGEHGGERFKTTDAIVDVVNPQQIKVETVFVGGSRGFEDQDAVAAKMASLQMGSVVLVSPTHGATAAVRKAALELGLEMHVHSARFEKYPTAEEAYFARDEEMIREADRVVVFWNGCSTGTRHEVEYANEIGKQVEIFMVDQRSISNRADLATLHREPGSNTMHTTLHTHPGQSRCDLRRRLRSIGRCLP